jgi:hypothetical protein
MAQQGIDYAKLAAQSGGRPVNPPPATVDYDALARASGGQPQTAPTGAPPTDTGGVSGFLREFWKQVNPLAIAQGIGQTVMHPIETGKTVLGAQGALLDKARASADQGDYVTATRHFMNYLLPLVGPGIDAAGDLMQEGRTAEGLGASTGLGVMLSAGGVKAPTKPVAPLRNQNPAVAAAVKQGQAAGVPIDLATASGNSFVANTQKVLGQTLGGSVAGGRAVRKQAQKLEEHGRQLASDVHPGAITPETAGASTIDALQGRVTGFSRDADRAYESLRAIEASSQPVNVQIQTTGRLPGGGQIPVAQNKPVRLAVDVRAAKESLRPLYDDLKRQATELNIPMQGGRARALDALDRLMRADDFASLSIVDAALGDLKALNRTNDTMATSGAHAITSQAVKALDAEVVKTARTAGPDVLKALLDGRKATVAKYHAGDVLDAIGGVSREPVGAFRRAIQSGDAGIARLRQLAKETPGQMPQIGRAVLDDLFEKATAEGGFARTDGLWRSWQNLGPETKKLLYTKPGQVQALDNFFLLAKKINENPNKSGTALTAVSGSELSVMGAAVATGNPVLLLKSAGVVLTTAGLTKAMYSPRLVRLLTAGLQMPASGPQVAAWTNAFTKAARDAGVELVPIPAGAEGQSKSQ